MRKVQEKTEEKCAELGLETLKNRRQDMTLVHKYVKNDRQDLYTLASNNRGARTRRPAGEKCLVKQFARTDKELHTVFSRLTTTVQIQLMCIFGVLDTNHHVSHVCMLSGFESRPRHLSKITVSKKILVLKKRKIIVSHPTYETRKVEILSCKKTAADQIINNCCKIIFYGCGS
jgi:hypothetical protein